MVSIQDLIFTELLYAFVDNLKNQVSPDENSIDFFVCQIFSDNIPDELKIQGLQFFDKYPWKLLHDFWAFFVFFRVNEIFREFFRCAERTGMVRQNYPPVLCYENISGMPVFVGNQVVESPPQIIGPVVVENFIGGYLDFLFIFVTGFYPIIHPKLTGASFSLKFFLNRR